ncbi:MAG TPA: hypothetical protein VEF04_17055, partial [Blastocatellia bacterium]|nr:hypothetical protein [Blastocatellia bacterium]
MEADNDDQVDEEYEETDCPSDVTVVTHPAVQTALDNLFLSEIDDAAEDSVSKELQVSEQEDEDDISGDDEDDGLRKDDERLLEQLQIKKEFNDGKSQLNLSIEHPSFSKTQIHRIVHDKIRFDGSAKAGRKPALLMSTEVALAKKLQQLSQNHNIILTPTSLSKWCVVLWRAEHPFTTTDPPKFGPGWRRQFNRRHPQLELRNTHVPSSQKRREEASTLANVAGALNHYKMQIGEIEAKYVYVADEFDASANDKGLGSRRLAVGKVMPKHIASNATPHVSSIPFVCLSGFNVFTQFVVKGSGHHRPDSGAPTLRNGAIIYNVKGSVDSDSWFEICRRFAAYIDERFGQAPRNHRVILFFDGYPVHENAAAMVILEVHGITAVRIQPNLTHLIQINDHRLINGKIQGAIRELKAYLCQENQGKMVPVEWWCHMVEGTILSSITHQTVSEAARSIGIEYRDGLTSITMTNASIERALQRFLLEGKIRIDPDIDDQGKCVLRSNSYIDYMQHALQNGVHARPFSEAAIHAVHEYGDELLYERTGTA